ncbi:CrcB family protein [Gracilibacillus sp. S3-1-1]|uniref:CrcB family protein n=1 Tax=Gracilibacillus pellucidus TaxID=3095368 RepID=A0ACC6M1A4_9BACI|nr:CrcB family protein [Gracilibacillus sp. S3-1-1]MDX8044714.1 CrcB family protein [Gracilibacillus sp. S3-1-1]
MNKGKIFLAVGIGGMIGATLRYALAQAITFTSFPLATAIENVIGCFVLAYVTFHPFIKGKLSSEVFTAITTGVLGSFTTFSTFIAESVLLLDQLEWMFLYLALQTFACIGCCFIGAKLAKRKEKAA